MISSASPGSNLGSIVRVAPTRREAFMLTVWPKEWKSGSEPRTTSPSSILQVVCEAISALRVRLRWVSSAPFGLPVVPEV